MATYGVGPAGRVRQAEKDYAQGKISANEMKKRVRAEGYTPVTTAEVKEKYKRARS